MDKHIIIGIHIVDREMHAVKIQEILTCYGDQIKTRIGMHDDICAKNGLILLEMIDSSETTQMMKEIGLVKGVEFQSMEFNH